MSLAYPKPDGRRYEQRRWRSPGFTRPSRASRGRRLVPYAIAAVVALVPGGAVGYAVAAKTGPFAPAPSLVWGGEQFRHQAEFEAWLNVRGVSYPAWAAKHRASAAKLEGRLP